MKKKTLKKYASKYQTTNKYKRRESLSAHLIEDVLHHNNILHGLK